MCSATITNLCDSALINPHLLQYLLQAFRWRILILREGDG